MEFKRLTPVYIFLFAVLAVPGARALAAELKPLQLKSSSEVRRAWFSFGLETAGLNFPNSQLRGYGARLGFDYSIWKQLSIGASFSQEVSPGATGTSYLYTGLMGSAKWAIFGDFMGFERTVTREGVVIFAENSSRKSAFALGVGLEQLLLNGIEQLYSTPGVSLSVNYYFPVSAQLFQVGLRKGFFFQRLSSFDGVIFDLSIMLGL